MINLENIIKRVRSACTNAKENAKVNERNPEYFKNKYSDNATVRKAYASKQYEAIKLKKLLEAQA